MIPPNLIIHLRVSPDSINEDGRIYYKGGSFPNDALFDYKPLIPSEPSPFVETDHEVMAEKGEPQGIMGNSTESNASFLQNEDSQVSETKFVASPLRCWWDCNQFDGTIYRLPIHFNPDKTYSSIGSFCSPSCALAYNYSHTKDSFSTWKRCEYINTMYSDSDGMQPGEPIRCAPPRETLTDFGGSMSVDEFRNTSKHVCISYPPIRLVKPITTVINDVPKIPSMQIAVDTTRIELAERDVESKRTKEDHKNPVTLDAFMSNFTVH